MFWQIDCKQRPGIHTESKQQIKFKATLQFPEVCWKKKASQHVLDAFQNSLKDKIVLTCLPEKIIYETTGTFSFLLDICLPYSQLSSIFEETASLTRC